LSSRTQKQWAHREEDRQLRQVRKQIKRHRKTKRVRRKDWLPDDPSDPDALYDLDVSASERVMPRGERTRRQDVLAEALARVREQKDREDGQDGGQPQGERGIVVEVSSSLCRVDLDGRILVCGIRGSLSAEETGFTNVVAVGDEVIVSEDGADGGVVEMVLPRRSFLARPDTFREGGRVRDRHLDQVIVANADQLLIVASWHNPPLWPELVDRYLIAAQRNHLAPVICVNKIDLAPDSSACRTALQPYIDLGHQVLFTSALTGAGVSELRTVLQGRTTVLAGLSGVGKSSLLAAVQPGFQLRTGEVSERTGEGRHTTSQVSLLYLEMGGAVIDTPGIREFGLRGLSRAELIQFYPEIAAASKRCRFSNCSHVHEPGCAVRAAIQSGTVLETRYHSYQNIYDALPA
jgi:ribosome biogenesis GTPase